MCAYFSGVLSSKAYTVTNGFVECISNRGSGILTSEPVTVDIHIVAVLNMVSKNCQLIIETPYKYGNNLTCFFSNQKY